MKRSFHTDELKSGTLFNGKFLCCELSDSAMPFASKQLKSINEAGVSDRR